MILSIMASISTNTTDHKTTVYVTENNITILGKSYHRLGMIGSGPQWKDLGGIEGLYIKAGEQTNVEYVNKLNDHTTIHAHGQSPPMSMDGVPDLSGPPLAADKSPGNHSIESHYTPIPGTHFIHSHWGLQHELGVAAPMVVQGPVPPNYPLHHQIGDAHDAILFLEDYGAHSDSADNLNNDDVESVYQGLVAGWQAEMKDFNFSDCSAAGLASDVEYRFHLANSRVLEEPIAVVVPTKNTNDDSVYVRLRIVNSAGLSTYRVQILQVSGNQTGSPITVTVLATDGHWVQPYQTDSVWLTNAHRLDLLLKLKNIQGSVYLAQAVAAGGEPSGQSGLVIVVGTPADVPPAGTFSSKADVAPGWMGLWETGLRAWQPLLPSNDSHNYLINLTGDNGFMSINQKSWQLRPSTDVYTPNPSPITVQFGQRVCLTFQNFNADPHSMHLHGHVFQIVAYNATDVMGPLRDTVNIPRGECNRVKVCFDAVNPFSKPGEGKWPLHCHVSYHLAAGMLTTLEYA